MAPKGIPKDETIPVARVPKITTVKEGQEHPVGKHGQYKLFHEHVWPKGYTPERLRQVSDAQFQVTAGGFHPINTNNEYERDRDRAINNKIGSALVNDHIARSTIPADDVKHLAENVSFWIGKDTPYPETNSFSLSGQTVNMALKSNDTSGDIQAITTHELGHAMDYLKDPSGVWAKAKEQRDDSFAHRYAGDTTAHPMLEGAAEGYRLAHSRVTRGQKNTGGDWTKWGYSPKGWVFRGQGDAFLRQRNETFKEATGHHFEEPKDTGLSSYEGRKTKHPTLFDQCKIDTVKQILLRILAAFAATGLSVVGAGAIAGIPLWKAIMMAGIGGVSFVVEGLARAFMDDGKLTIDEINDVFNKVEKKGS